MKSFGRLFSRSRNHSGSKPRKAAPTRRLRSETLEKRQLLAGDFLAHHNYLVPQDVNRDFEITPMDALTVINALNRHGSGSVDRIPVTENSAFVDVSGDNFLSPMDALQVINALSRGEGIDELIELRLDVREHQSNLIDPSKFVNNPPFDESLLDEDSRTYTASVGEIFDLEVSYNDLRSGSNKLGAFTVFADLFTPDEARTFSDFVEPILTETQGLAFFGSSLNDADGGEIVFSLETSDSSTFPISPEDSTEGVDWIYVDDEWRPTFTVSTDDFNTGASAAISEALRSFGFTETTADGTQLDQFEVTRSPLFGGEPGATFERGIRFLGDAWANQQIPNLVVDLSGVTSSEPNFEMTSEVFEVPAINADGSPNSAAIRFNIITNSRTTPSNSTYYDLFTAGSFGADGFDDVGATAFVINPQGIPGDLDPFPFEQPFDVFSLPVRMKQAVDDFVIQLGPPPDSTITLFTHPDDEDAQNDVPSDLIKIATEDDPSTAEDDRFGLVVIDAVETTPIANDGSMTLNEDLDPSGGNTIDLLELAPGATITAVSGAFLGSVTLDGSEATYTPAPDVNGSDFFTFNVTRDGEKAIRTVTVTINPINDPPRPVDDAIIAAQATRIIEADELTGNDSAGPADEPQQLTIAGASRISGVTEGAVVFENGVISYTPPSGFAGIDRFRYTVRDSEGLTASAEVMVTVVEVLAANPDTLTTDEDTPLTFTTGDLLANDTGNGSFVGLTENLDPATEGTIVDNGDGTFTYTPPADLFGDALATFTYTITDDESEATATVTIDVNFVNDPPIAVDDNFSVDELTTTELDVLANDSPGPPSEDFQTITIINVDTTGTAGEATIINNGQNIAFTPSELAPSQTTLSYTIEDSGGLTATATVTIDVVPVTRPRARNDTRTVAEDSGVLNIDVLANDLPNTGEQVTLEGIGALLQGNATITIDDGGTPDDKTDDTINVTPADNFFGTIRFTYSIKDTGIADDVDVEDPAAATGTVTVNVTPVNDPPIFVPDENRVTEEDTELTIDGNLLLENDLPGPADEDPPFDESDQTLRITAVNETSQQGGTVTLGANNQITYSPRLDFNGTDVITYTISDDGTDGLGEDEQTTQGTLTITVTPVNDPPVPGSPSFDATEDEVLVLTEAQVLAGSQPGPPTATDELENQALSVTGSLTGSSEAGGNVSVAADGTVTYTPLQDYFGPDSFVLIITDDGTPPESANLTVSLDVAFVNDPPIAGDDVVNAFQNVVATISAEQLLANDVAGPPNEDFQTLTITSVRKLTDTQGEVSLNEDGSVRFEPITDFEGETRFEYTVSDNDPENPLTDTAIVTVNVQKFQPSSISGSVFFDEIESLTNPVRNGVQDAGEAGLSGVTVTLSGDAEANVTGEAISRSFFTQLDGSFDFNNLPPGTFTVNFDLPSHVMDGPDVAGSLGDADSEDNQFTINIAEPGGVQADNYRFTVIGLTGPASETGSILAIDFLDDNPDANDDSDSGRRGGTAGLNADGQMTFFKGRDGFDDARFIEVAVNEDQDEALLSYIDKTTNTVFSARLKENQFLIVPDGDGGAILRIFGGLDNFDFADSAEGLLNQEFGEYRDAIDQIMAEQA